MALVHVLERERLSLQLLEKCERCFLGRAVFAAGGENGELKASR